MSFQPTREALAQAEIGRTDVSRPLAAFLAAALVLLTVAVPVVEVARALDGGAGPWQELTAAARQAAATLRRGELLEANRRLLAGMNASEDRLEEESAVAAAVLPPAQWVSTALLGVGNQRAYLGRGEGPERWLYFRPDVEHVTGRGFLEPEVLAARGRGGDAWEEAPQPDPRPAILDFARRLAKRQIALVVVPAPVKPTIHPERLAGGGWAGRRPVRNPSFDAFVRDLEAAGVPVFDPAPVLLAALAQEGAAPQYLATDTHWTPQAVERVAAELARFLAERELLPAAADVAYERGRTEVANTGDIANMLELPAWSRLFPPQQVGLRPVREPGGRPWRPDPQADLLLLGDSFTNVYSQGGLGWGEGAGLAEQLSFHLGRPLDRIAVNAGGAYTARERVAAAAARGDDRLAGKRLVIYQFAARELSGGDWKLLPLDGGTGGAATGPGASAGPDALGDPGAAAAPGRAPAGPGTAGGPLPRRQLGDGFLVWESKRSGDWRIWTRRLDGSGLRQLSPDEPGWQHCCPHISPDGRRVVYLSRTVGAETYPEEEVPGRLWLVGADGSGRRLLAESARTYGWGNRAAVWRPGGELIHVGGDGRTLLLDVESGRSRPLTTEPREELGWLVDPTLSWAVTAAPNFSLYDADSRQVAERQPFAGCEPYFSFDGRWGFWIAGGGGPLNRIELADRRISTVLERDDPRVAAEKRYMYFPMLSRDGRLLAWGASRGSEEHDHFRADYDVYVAPVDPRTLELTGQPVKMTDHPGPDRYPDVFAAPLELGYHSGEAPLTVRLDPGAAAAAGGAEAADWEWDFGDGRRERARRGEHTYRRAGVYEVRARRGGRELAGQVVVEAAAPPRVVGVVPREGGRQLLVRFDEPVRLEGAAARLESGRRVAGLEAGPDGRSLLVRPAGELEAGDRLWLEGVSDRAAVPNRLPAGWHDVEPPAWPSDRRDLYFLWQTAEAPNLAYDPRLAQERAFPLEFRGRGRVAGDGALVLEPGAWYAAPDEAAENLRQAMRANAALTIEATLTPARARTAGWAPIASFRSRGGRDEFTLGQQGAALVLRVRDSGIAGPAGNRQVRLAPVAAGESFHLVVSYGAGRLAVYRDGEPVAAGDEITTGFAGWRRGRLDFGVAGEAEWQGTLQGIALYGRALTAAEARENALRYRRLQAGHRRPAAERLEVRGRLAAKSKIPTLQEISPYRRALAVYEYEVAEVLAGRLDDRRVRVAHWVILDGERQPVAAAATGGEHRLTLEPFAANPQLEGHYLSDTLPPAPRVELYYAGE